MIKISNRAKGGLARAASLSPERRREIATNAANKRFNLVSPIGQSADYSKLARQVKLQTQRIEKLRAKLTLLETNLAIGKLQLVLIETKER